MEKKKLCSKVCNYIIALLIIALLVALDQVSKYLAVQFLSAAQGGSDLVLWKGVFCLHYLENYGAAFGMLQGKKLFLVMITALIFGFVLWFYGRIPTGEKRFLAMRGLCLFVMAGAVGNFIDRIILGYVVDFFYFELINFPVFNVADIYVSCSVVLFLILFLFYYKDEDLNRILKKKKEKTEDAVSGI